MKRFALLLLFVALVYGWPRHLKACDVNQLRLEFGYSAPVQGYALPQTGGCVQGFVGGYSAPFVGGYSSYSLGFAGPPAYYVPPTSRFFLGLGRGYSRPIRGYGSPIAFRSGRWWFPRNVQQRHFERALRRGY